jgi:hypothetical protein
MKCFICSNIISMKIKPSFIVIGAAKAGTTSLCGLLAQHPDINFSDPKEPRFFSDDNLFEKGWAWYESCFFHDPSAQHAGEGSVHYSMCTLFPNASHRIASALPDVKIIYIVRHPLKRIISHWKMYDRSADPKFKGLNEDVLNPDYRPNLIDASKYSLQLSVYQNYFPEDQIKVLFFEEFISDQASVINQCWDFIGVSKLEQNRISFEHKNRGDSVSLAKPGLNKMKTIPIIREINKSMPSNLKSRVRKRMSFLYHTRGSQPIWQPDVKKRVLDEIQEDAISFLKLQRKPSNYWDL